MGTDDFERIETKTCIAIVASLVALVVSIFCVCPTLPRVLSTEELNFDYLGLITGILSVLITLLIGWNIYTIIDVKQFKKETNDILKEQANEVGAMIYQMHAQSLFYDMHNPKEAIMQIMQAVELANKLRGKDTLGGIISFIVRMRNDLNTGLYVYKSSVKFNSDTIDKYCQLLRETNNPQALEITGFIRSLKY